MSIIIPKKPGDQDKLPPIPDWANELPPVPEWAKQTDASLVKKGVNIALDVGRNLIEGAVLDPLRFAVEVGKRIHPDPGAKYIERKYGQRPEQLFGGNIPKIPEPEMLSTLQGIAGGAARLGGEVFGAPGKLVARAGAKLVAPAVAKATGKRFLGKIAGEAVGLGGMLTVANPEAGKDVEELLKTFGEGAVLGSIFGTTRLATIPKVGPLVNNIVRQFGTRGLAAVAGQYSPEMWKNLHGALVRGEKLPDEFAQNVFNEALFSYFSWKKGTGKHITEAEIEAIRKQADESGLLNKKLEEMVFTSARKPEDIAAGVARDMEYIRRYGSTKPIPVPDATQTQYRKAQAAQAPFSATAGEPTWMERPWEQVPQKEGIVAREQIRGVAPVKPFFDVRKDLKDIVLGKKAAPPVGTEPQPPKVAVIPEAVKEVVSPSTPISPAIPAKQPWEMTRQAFSAQELYHVTLSKTATKIKKDGIIPQKKHITSGQFGKVLSDKDTIYAFTNYDDAVRWAAKMKWDTKEPISIIRYSEGRELYQPDAHFEAGAAKGEWLKKQGMVPPGAIQEVIQFSDEMTPRIVKTLAEKGPGISRHAELVERALLEGKPVPPEVLKDYPDLMTKVQPGRTLGKGEYPLTIESLPPDAEYAVTGAKGQIWQSKGTGQTFLSDGAGNFKDITKPGDITMSSGIPVWDAVKKVGDYFEAQYDADMKAESRRTTAKILGSVSKVFDKERRLIAGLKVENNLRRMGPGGEKIADSAVRFVKDHTQLFTRSMSAIKTSYELMRKGMGIPLLPSKLPVFRGKKDAIITRRLADLVEGKYPPATPNEKTAVDIFRGVMRTYAEAADALGVKISSPWGEKKFGKGLGETYFPVEYMDVEAFLNSPREHFQHLRDLYIEQYAKKQFPKEMADPDFAPGAIEKAKAAFNAYRQDLASKHFGHLESERILTEADIIDIRAKWEKIYPGKPFPLERKYSITSVMDYLDRAAERLSWVQNFGQDIALPKGGGMIPERIKDFLETLNIPDNQRYVNKFFRDYLGRSGETSRVAKVTDFLRRWNAQKLMFSGIPNATQWITNTLPNMPTDVWLKSIADAAKFPFDKVTKDFMSLTGASALSETHQFAHLGSKRPLDVFNRVLLQLNGFNAGEIWNATQAAFSGKHVAEKYSRELIKSKGQGWRDPHRIAELKKFGFTDEGIRMMIETGQGPTLNQLADAAFHSRRMFQFMADAFSRPARWRSPLGRLLTQFKNFAYNQSSLLYNEPLKEFMRFLNPTMKVDGKTEFALGRQGDPTKLAKAMIALPVAGYLVTTAKDWVYDKLGLNLYADILDGKSDGLKLITYIMNAGGLGIAMDAALAINRGLPGAVSFVGGPTAGDLAKFVEWVAKAGGDAWKAIKYWDAKWLSLRLPTIKQYTAEFFAGVSPEAKVAITNLFSDYSKVRTANQWNAFYQDAREDYKHYFRSKGQAFADEYWHAMENTVGKEYQEKFGRRMNKPTPKEIAEWESEQGKPVSERINMGGTKVNKITW